MKLNFKKILTAAAIGLAATFQISSNLNVSAETIEEECPKLVLENNQLSNDKLVVVTCMEKQEGTNNFVYFFSIPLHDSEILKPIKNNNLKVVVKKQNVKVAEANLELDKTFNHNDEGFDFLKFEIPAKDLEDTFCDFEIFDGEKSLGSFKNVKLKKEDYIVKDEDILKSMDRSTVLSKDNTLTNDSLTFCMNRPRGEKSTGIDVILELDSDCLKKLAKKVKGEDRKSALKDYDNLTIVFKDQNTNEKVLEKKAKKVTKTIGSETVSSFMFNLNKDEISFEKDYKIDFLNEQGELVGTLNKTFQPKFFN